MPRKGENIYKRKDGRWEGRYIRKRSEEGKPMYGYVYAHSYREVKQKLIICIQTSGVPPTEPSPASSEGIAPTFEKISGMWMDAIRSQIKESTYIKYRNSLRNYILPKLGMLSIHELTYAKLEAYVSSILTSGGQKEQGLSPKTVADVVAIIRAILMYANKHGYDIKCLEVGLNVKQYSNSKLTVLSKSEQLILQNYLINNMNNQNLGILLCLYTGLRVGELCALTWDDISISEKQLYVHSTMQRLQTFDSNGPKTKVIITNPKSLCSIRKIPIPDSLISLMCEHFSNSNGYVLSGKSTQYIEPRSMQNHFKRVLKECELNDVNMHALRHTFATRCVELGFDIKSLSEILGHASVNITMNRYVHPSMELKKENMNKLDDLFSVK